MRSASYNDQAIELARASGNKRSLTNCLALRAALASPVLTMTTFSMREPLTRYQQEMEEVLTLADSIGWQAGQALAHYNASLICTSSGHLGQGLAWARRGLACASELEDSQWLAACSYALGFAYLHLLDPLEALPTLENGWRSLVRGVRPSGSG